MTYEYITRHNSPNYYTPAQCLKHYGRKREILGITIHWWNLPEKKPTFEGTIGYLCRSGGNTSAHEVIEAGRVAPIVNHINAAWHSGSSVGNATTIGLECNPRASDADYETIGERVADLWIGYGNKLPLYRHSDWKNTRCPGDYDLNRIRRIAEKYYAAKVNKPQPAPEPESDMPNLTVWGRSASVDLPKGKETRIPLTNKGNEVSSVFSNKLFDVLYRFQFSGLPVGAEAQVRAYIEDMDADGNQTGKRTSIDLSEIPGTSGGTFGQYIARGRTGPNQRVRVYATVFVDGVKCESLTTRSFTW